MAGNEDHPFASIVAAYRESQPVAAHSDVVADEVPATDVEASDLTTSSSTVPPVETPAPEEAVETATPEDAASEAAPAAEAASPEPSVEPTPEPSEVVADAAVPVEAPAPAAEDVTPAPPVEPPAPTADVAASAASRPSDAPTLSALVDPSKSILAAYYAQGAAEMAAAMQEPVPVAAEPVAAESPVDSAAAIDPEAGDLSPSEQSAEPTIAAVLPADVEPEPEPVLEPEPEIEPVAEATPVEATAPAAEPEATVEPSQDTASETHNVWGRHSGTSATAGAAASVLAAYYADANEATPAVPAAAAQPWEPAADPAPKVESPAASAAAPPAGSDATTVLPVVDPAELSPAPDATAVLPVVGPSEFPAAPSNPLGSRPTAGDWGAQALRAAGSSVRTEPMREAQLPASEPTAVRGEVTPSTTPTPTDDKPSDARRKFLMLAPIGAIAAIAVLAVLLWNGQHAKPSTGSTSTPPSSILVAGGTPLKRTQAAYASALTRFTAANDPGAAILAGGAAHDTIKLLKDFKGATAADKALLAAERAHLSSLSGLATTTASDFADATSQARNTLNAVQKAAAADAKAKAPNSSAGTAQAIELLGEGNVTKLQSALVGLVSRSDAASLTASLRGVATEAASNADAANSLASVLKNNTVQATASSLANKFSAMAPMARLNADTLSDWSNIRPGMVAALGLDPVSHIDTLIANAKQKLATWKASQGDNASITAINNYANAMRSHFGSFGNALGQIPSLSAGETGAAGIKSGAQGQAGNAYVAVNRAAFGGSPPPSLVGAHNSLVDAINAGSRAATAARNVTVFCTSSSCTYGQQGDWGGYSGNIWVKGGWGSKVGAWESAVSSALRQASASVPKPVV